MHHPPSRQGLVEHSHPTLSIAPPHTTLPGRVVFSRLHARHRFPDPDPSHTAHPPHPPPLHSPRSHPGFSESVQVFSAADTHYPVNAARCCTPSLLLSNGDAWELERCDCAPGAAGDSPDVSCGGTNTHKLLAGYADRRATPLGQSVPVAPADCCALCLSRHFHPMSQCDDLANCNKRGVCNLGACDCFQGWAGPDCSARDGRGGRDGRGVPGWAVTLIVLGGLAVASMFALIGGHVLRLLGERVGERVADAVDGGGRKGRVLGVGEEV